MQWLMRLLSVMVSCGFIGLHAGDAEWSFLTFIQGDSNLSPFAEFNINAMERGVVATDKVNVLVQMDLPLSNLTYRYKIVDGKRVDVSSLDVGEMGYNPREEVVAAVRWMKDNYPAKKYALVLWNHGNGVLDELPGGYTDEARRRLHRKLYGSWIEIPGISQDSDVYGDRGILYDYTQQTYLSNPALRDAMLKSKDILGKKIDFLGMDACFMAMLEIAYQIRDCADILVGSEEVEPGDGWDYSVPLRLLTSSPFITSRELALSIVQAYGSYYESQRESIYTQSAIDLSKCDQVVKSLGSVVAGLENCRKIKSSSAKTLIFNARSRATFYDNASYIDLSSWYDELLIASSGLRRIDEDEDTMPDMKFYLDDAEQNRSRQRINQVRPKPKPSTLINAAAQKNWSQAIISLRDMITKAQEDVRQMVIAHVAGDGSGVSRGVAIYYPAAGDVQSTYGNTEFAKQTSWVSFIKKPI